MPVQLRNAIAEGFAEFRVTNFLASVQDRHPAPGGLAGGRPSPSLSWSRSHSARSWPGTSSLSLAPGPRCPRRPPSLSSTSPPVPRTSIPGGGAFGKRRIVFVPHRRRVPEAPTRTRISAVRRRSARSDRRRQLAGRRHVRDRRSPAAGPPAVRVHLGTRRTDVPIFPGLKRRPAATRRRGWGSPDHPVALASSTGEPAFCAGRS